MYLLGCLLFVALIIVILGLNSTVMLFVNIPSLILILGFTFPILMASGLLVDFVKSFKVAIIRENTATKFELKRMLLANSLAMTMFILSGAIGTLIGAVAILNSAEMGANLLPSIAVSLVTVSYGFIFMILLIPIRVKIKAILLSLE